MIMGQMPNKYLIVAVILVAVCLGAGVFYGWQGGQRPQSTENFEVVYTLISSWSVMSDTITIRNDGNIIEYTTRIVFGGGEENEMKVGKLTEYELQDFKKLVIEANVFSFENTYIDETVLDAPGELIKFSINGRTKTISMYAPRNLPEKLAEIIQQIYVFKDKL